MAQGQQFIATIAEMLAPLGQIGVRRMFGSAALYCDGEVFALLYDDVLYLKIDEHTRGAFEAEGCGPFLYPMKTGVQVIGGYHRAPDRLLDETDELLAWARAAIGAGRRRAAVKAAGKRKSTKTAPTADKPMRADQGPAKALQPVRPRARTPRKTSRER